MFVRSSTLLLLALVALSNPARAQERAYFVTYDHYLEEPRNIEIAIASTSGLPKDGHSPYHAPWMELEYGITGWWTTELYLEGVTTHTDGSGFTGWRLENRFRPFKGEHRINPVLYFEYEDTSEASRIQKEFVGSGGISYEPISALRTNTTRELEGKLILSSAAGNWNIAENFIFEKNLSEEEGLEFGYSVAVSRPLGTIARGVDCRFCPENFVIGLEAYGGLGSTLEFASGEQRHYVAPVVAWHITAQSTLKASVAAGLTQASDHALIRVAYVHEFRSRGRE